MLLFRKLNNSESDRRGMASGGPLLSRDHLRTRQFHAGA